MERLTIPDTPIEGGLRRTVIDAREVRKHAMTIYWQLKKYEDVGLTPDQIREMDKLYLAKCEEVNQLKAELETERQKHRWIPVEERLPDKSGAYIVTARDGDLAHVTFCKWQTRYKRWDLTGSRAYWKVIAWQPLLEPYQPEKG